MEWLTGLVYTGAMLRRLIFVVLAGCSSASSGTPDSKPSGDGPVRDGQVDEDAALDDAPIDGAMAGCAADSECPAGVCHESTGECVAEASVLFVAMGGDDSGTCTRAAPCGTIGKASTLLAPGKDTIAVAAGTYPGVFTLSMPALLSGPSTDPKAVFLTSPNASSIIARFDGAAVFVEGVSIGGNTTTNAPQAVTIHNAADVTFDRVIVRDNDATGVFVSGSTLTVRRYEAFASDYGVLANETSTIHVDRAYVHGNTSAGLAAAGVYDVTNTFLAKNAIGFIPFNNNTGTLDFVTFASQTSTVISSTHAIPCTNSIFWMNPSGPSAMVAVSYSMFSGTAPAGTGNFQGDPMFANEPMGDYHLGMTSQAIDRANPASTMATDYDGAPRPSGTARDVGADER